MALTNEKVVVDEGAIKAVLETGSAEDVAKVIAENIVKSSNAIQTQILEEAKTFNITHADAAILAKRGFAPLTAEETKYYNDVTDAGSFDGIPMPRTIFDRVFDDLAQNHALLSEIVFVNTTGVTEWLTRTGEAPAAWWGPLTGEIKKKLDTAFKARPTTLAKLSAYIPVAKSMLDLGPAWIDKYARAVMTESAALALEEAIIAGTGKDQPIGMMYKLDDVTAGTHVMKTPVAITDLKPATIGSKILGPLTTNRDTTLGKVLLLVNPTTYYAKIFPKLVVVDQFGVYHRNELPFNGEIVQSAAVPVDRMVVGDPKKYFCGLGSDLKMTHSDDFRLLDDQRVYVAKQYATGEPNSDDDFILFDISGFGTGGI